MKLGRSKETNNEILNKIKKKEKRGTHFSGCNYSLNLSSSIHRHLFQLFILLPLIITTTSLSEIRQNQNSLRYFSLLNFVAFMVLALVMVKVEMMLYGKITQLSNLNKNAKNDIVGNSNSIRLSIVERKKSDEMGWLKMWLVSLIHLFFHFCRDKLLQGSWNWTIWYSQCNIV